MEAHQSKAIRLNGRDRQTALSQGTGAFVAIIGGLGAGGCEVSLRRARILGSIEMLGHALRTDPDEVPHGADAAT